MAKKKAEKNMVAVHSCFDIELGELLPSVCACNLPKSLKEAKTMVGNNEAEWVLYKADKNGLKVKAESHQHICLIGGMARRTPRSATIDAKHIERAFVDGDMEEKHRIREYGDLNFAFFQSLKKWVPFEKYRADEARDWGIPVIQNNRDERTPGGINKENR